MNTQHINDKVIQRFVFENKELDLKTTEHINSCVSCKEKIDHYILLSKELSVLEVPDLQFDLPELVISQLDASPPKKEAAISYFIYGIIVLSVAVVGFACFYFKDAFGNIFHAISMFSNYFIMSVVLFVAIGLGLDMFRTYYKKMKMLDFS